MCFVFRAQGVGRVSGFGFRVSRFVFLAQGFGIRVSCFVYRSQGFGLLDSGFELRDSGFGFKPGRGSDTPGEPAPLLHPLPHSRAAQLQPSTGIADIIRPSTRIAGCTRSIKTLGGVENPGAAATPPETQPRCCIRFPTFAQLNYSHQKKLLTQYVHLNELLTALRPSKR